MEYKYVIANYSKPEAGAMQWEEGCNRQIVLTETDEDEIYLSNIGFILDEKWNYEKITLKIKEPEADELSVIGNAIDLGTLSAYAGVWASKRLMKCESNRNGQKLWSTTFYLEKAKDYLRYYYVKVLKGEVIREKEPGRYLFMDSAMDATSNLSGRELISWKPGEIIVVDLNDVESFKITEITNEMVVGPYVHC